MVDLLARVDVVVAGVADGVPLDAVDRVGRNQLAALGEAQDRAEDDEHLGRGAGAVVASVPALDVLAGDRGDVALAKRW
jgi:hypothetical protein